MVKLPDYQFSLAGTDEPCAPQPALTAVEAAAAELRRRITYEYATGQDVRTLASQRIIYPFFYLRTHEDLLRHYGPDDIYGAYDHYLQYGMREGRCATPFFNPKFYLHNGSVGDLSDAFPEAARGEDYTRLIHHWVDFGIAEGRWGTPLSMVVIIKIDIRTWRVIMRRYFTTGRGMVCLREGKRAR